MNSNTSKTLAYKGTEYLKASIKTHKMGKRIELYDTIGSTNNRARDLAFSGAPEGTLILAETQLEGRGRLGRTWISPKGKGIWMSLILRPDIMPAQASRIIPMAAIAIRRGLQRETGLEFGIKWPNDIIQGDKKVCGILTEMQGAADKIHSIILGIGINANLDKGDFPEGLISKASSLKIILGKDVDRENIIGSVLEELEDIYFKYLRGNDFRPIREEYKRYSYSLNRQVRVIGKEGEFHGLAVDIDDEGSLMVQRDDGEIIRVFSGEVSVRGSDGYV